MDTKHLITQLNTRIEACYEEMVATLIAWSNLNTGTENIKGLRAMYDLLHAHFSPMADVITRIDLDPIDVISLSGVTQKQAIAPMLFIQKRPDASRRILLCGHMDTVYSIDNPFQNVRRLDDNTLNGPGVADMKGGIVVLSYALQLFEEMIDAPDFGIDILINTDEEIGSPASRAFIESIASRYIAGLCYEPAMTKEGLIAKNRRGSGKFTLIAKGKSAHVGRAFHEGRNAICYLAEVLLKIDALNGQFENITINVGKIAGGTALNVVPDLAVAKLDVRIGASEDEAIVMQALHGIQKEMERSGFELCIHGHFGRPVKRVCAKTEALFAQLVAIGHDIGLQLDWRDSGGCCDGNNLARQGLPVIDTLGVRGGDIHSAQEFILLDSLKERTLLSTLLLAALATNPHPL